MSDTPENKQCTYCKGKGFREVKRVCSQCDGSGEVLTVDDPIFPFRYQKCPSCEGSPVSMVKEACSWCDGLGHLEPGYLPCSMCEGKGRTETQGYYIGDRYIKGTIFICPLCKGKGEILAY